jgi:hypothetical protein
VIGHDPFHDAEHECARVRGPSDEPMKLVDRQQALGFPASIDGLGVDALV